MTEELLTDAVLREFLLGRVNDDERARIESLFLIDSEAREKVLVLEQELIEDYLEDSLSTEDRETFLLRYGQTAAQRQQLRIDKAINEWALKENASSQTVPAGLSTWDRLRMMLRLRPQFVIPIATAAMIAIVVGGIWLNSRMKRAAVERELAQLNTEASLREALPNTASLVLSPIVVRSIEQQNELKKSPETRVVELILPWIQKQRYPTYTAQIRRIGSDETSLIPNLPASSNGPYAIRVRVPAQMLTRGQYQILLRGVSADGVPDEIVEYQFAVSE